MSTLKTDNIESLDTGRVIEVDSIASRNNLAGDPADGLGAALVNGTVIHVTSVTELPAAPTSDAQYITASFWRGEAKGGNIYAWDSAKSKTAHNGYSVIDPGKVSELVEPGDFGTYFDPAGSGTGCFILIKANIDLLTYDFGGVGGGVIDDTLPLQKHFNVRSGKVPGDVWLITDTIDLGNSNNVQGENAFWSNGSTVTELKWGGAAGGVMVKAAANNPFSSGLGARSNVKFRYFKLNGNHVAGYGFFGSYLVNEGEISYCTAVGCNYFGFLIGFCYYIKIHTLTARSNDGIGIAFNYPGMNGSDSGEVNGVEISNLRAHSCGSAYDAGTSPYGYDPVDNDMGGCGIFIRVGRGTYLSNTMAELSYAHGVVIESISTTGVSNSSGFYFEGNAADAVSDGKLAEPEQLLLVSSSNTGNQVGIANVFTSVSNYGYAGIIFRADQKTTFLLSGFTGWEFRNSGAGGEDKVVFENTNNISVDNSIVNGSKISKGNRVTETGFGSKSTTGSPLTGGLHETAITSQKAAWTSGADVLLATVFLRVNQNGDVSIADMEISVMVSAYAATARVQGKVQRANIQLIATKRPYSINSAATVTLHETTSRFSSDTLFGDISINIVETEASNGFLYEIYGNVTSSGDIADNRMAASMTLHGAGLRVGNIPNLTTE